MKKALCFLLTLCVLASFFCVGAAAAENDAASGIYALAIEEPFAGTVTLTPKTADGITVQAGSATLNGQTVSGFYANAEKVKVTYTGAQSGAQYVVLVLNDASAAPTEGNTVYIDQTEAAENNVTFTVYPGRLENNKLYSIYLSSSSTTGPVQGLTKIASFRYFAPYILGDVNEDGSVNTMDAMLVVNHFVGNTELTGNRLFAADVNGDGFVNTLDAMRIVNLFVGNIDQF